MSAWASYVVVFLTHIARYVRNQRMAFYLLGLVVGLNLFCMFGASMMGGICWMFIIPNLCVVPHCIIQCK